MEMMFPKYSNWVTIKWTKESAESIIRKYQEVVEQLNGPSNLLSALFILIIASSEILSKPS
jgi:hypothetical protein